MSFACVCSVILPINSADLTIGKETPFCLEQSRSFGIVFSPVYLRRDST